MAAGSVPGGILGIPRQDEPRLVGEDDGLDAVAQVELGEDVDTWVLTVASPTTRRAAISAFDRPRATSREHLELARGQLVERGSRPDALLPRRVGGPVNCVDEPAGDLGRQQRVAAGDGADRVDEVLGVGILEQEAAGAGAESVEDVLVEVEGGEDDTLAEVVGRRSGGSPRCRP